MITIALGALVALALAGPAAAATSCSAPTSQPFTRWLDTAKYQQVPGGTFESGLTGWTVSGGAKTVAGNEPFNVAGSGQTHSLSLPAGASVTSPSFCGGLGYPTIRLFSKTTGGLLPVLRAEVLYTDQSSVLRSFGLGVVTPSVTWQPSLPLLTLSGLPLLTGSQLALRLTATGGSFVVDDVFVDPYSRN